MSALFEPYTLRGMRMRNRLLLSPMCQYAATEGFVAPWHREHHSRQALGGLGGAVLEATAVQREGRITPGCLGIWSDDHVAGLAEIVEIYHRHCVAVGIQLAHAGRKASSTVPWEGNRPLDAADSAEAWEIVGPSPLAYAEGRPVPREMSLADIGATVAAFGAAARRGEAAGFDFVEIHGAHGYLIHSFLAAISNRREDAYGGTLHSRMRLAIETVRAVRAAFPADKPVLFRVSAIDGVEGGMTIDDTIALARVLKTEGVDMVDCSSGGIGGPSGVAGIPQIPGFQVPFAAQIRREAGLPTIAVGLIREPRLAEAIIAKGEADAVAIGRELLADAGFAYRAARELGIPRPEAILPLRFGFFLSRRPS